MPRIIACGSRNTAFDKFGTAIGAKSSEDFIVLLVDSEDPVQVGLGPWKHLARRDDWEKPDGVTDEHAHLMVQCMEAWFLADTEALAGYFASRFRHNALPGNLKIEKISKHEVLIGLRNATRRCAKGEYRKGPHSFEILTRIDPEKVYDASPHAKRLIDTLREKVTCHNSRLGRGHDLFRYCRPNRLFLYMEGRSRACRVQIV